VEARDADAIIAMNVLIPDLLRYVFKEVIGDAL
jgi:hypothetical protein